MGYDWLLVNVGYNLFCIKVDYDQSLWGREQFCTSVIIRLCLFFALRKLEFSIIY